MSSGLLAHPPSPAGHLTSLHIRAILLHPAHPSYKPQYQRAPDPTFFQGEEGHQHARLPQVSSFTYTEQEEWWKLQVQLIGCRMTDSMAASEIHAVHLLLIEHLGCPDTVLGTSHMTSFKAHNFKAGSTRSILQMLKLRGRKGRHFPRVTQSGNGRA